MTPTDPATWRRAPQRIEPQMSETREEKKNAMPNPQPTTRRIGTPALLLLALALVPFASGCGEEAEIAAVTAPPVMAASVDVRDVVDRIEATGQLLAKSQASVAAQVDGQVTSIHFDEGARVEAGQLIVEIDPQRRQLSVSSQRAQVTQARAQLAETERDLRRVQSLRQKGAVALSTVEEAETQLALARSRLEGAGAQLGIAERALADSSVRAPFGGLVARRYVHEGEFVSPGQPLFDLVALDEIEVEFHLAERDSSLVEIGDEVDVRVAPFPNETFLGLVSVVSPTIDPSSRTLRVKAEIENEGGRLKPGLFARADLGVAERKDVMLVPEEAVLLRADGSVVFRMKGDREVERIPVRTGPHRDGWIEIESGLQPNDRVVVRGHNGLIHGAVVQLRSADGLPPGVSRGGDTTRVAETLR